MLAERGVEGYSLREVARRAGVSPAAPAHHFGDAGGLLAAVATLAYDELTAALEAGNVRGGDDPVARLREQGIGYVGFALRYPGRFNLMFRTSLERTDALQHSANAAFEALHDGVRDLYGVARGAELALAQQHALLAIWSVVHGFAHLAAAGQFNHVAPAGGREALLREILAPVLQQQLEGLRGPVARPARARLSAKASASSRRSARPTRTR